MGANSFTIKKNATSLTTVGGTDQSFTETGADVPGGLNVADASVADFRIRPNITFKNRQPVKKADGTWSKAKRSAVAVVPKTLSSGSVEFDLVRIDVETSVETSIPETLNLQLLGGQILNLLAAFWQTGAVR